MVFDWSGSGVDGGDAFDVLVGFAVAEALSAGERFGSERRDADTTGGADICGAEIDCGGGEPGVCDGVSECGGAEGVTGAVATDAAVTG